MNYGFATVHQNKTQSFVVSEVPRSSGGEGSGLIPAHKAYAWAWERLARVRGCARVRDARTQAQVRGVRVTAFSSSKSKTSSGREHLMAENKVVDAHFVLESLAENKEEHFGPIEVSTAGLIISHKGTR